MPEVNLTTFLAARLDEDEAVAKVAGRSGFPARDYEPQWRYEDVAERLSRTNAGPDTFAHVARHDPARVLREVAAKRAILAAHPVTDRIVAYGCRDFTFGCETCHDWDGATEGRGYCETLRALAAVYGDHPDYQPEWRPSVTV